MIAGTKRNLGWRPKRETAATRSRQNVALRRNHRDPATYDIGITNIELTPEVRSAVMQLIDEVDRLKEELSIAQERMCTLETMADEDPLVPVLNRRGFIRELNRTIAFVKRYKTPVSLIYFDLDDFKSINDTHGHTVGDLALQHLGNLLLSNVRQSDIVGRLGGDEFAITLHHADLKAANAKANQLAEIAASKPCLFEDKEILLFLSGGATEIHPNDSPADILKRADRAMYACKTKHRMRYSSL